MISLKRRADPSGAVALEDVGLDALGLQPVAGDGHLAALGAHAQAAFHPVGQVQLGQPEIVAALDVDDLVAGRRRYVDAGAVIGSLP